MYSVVFDIETYGSDRMLSYKDFKYLKESGRHEEDEHVIESLSLNPFLSHIVSIAYVKLENNNNISDVEVIFLSDEYSEFSKKITYMGREYEVKFVPIMFKEVRRDALLQGEKKIIEKFFDVLSDATLIISFNGKKFDAHFLKIRSMLNDISISKIIYDEKNHLDLMEFLFPRGFRYHSFDFITEQFGLQSPKEKYEGKDVKDLFNQQKYTDIAEYNIFDVIALYNLYRKLEKYLIAYNTIKDRPSEKQMKYLGDLINQVSSLIQYEEIDFLSLKDTLNKSEVQGAISTLKTIKDNIEAVKRKSELHSEDDIELLQDDDDMPF